MAAVMVALFHAYVYSKWGGLLAQSGVLQHAWLFVDLFFVISGFVMIAAYGDRLNSWRSAAAYMVRRFFRLYPLHLVTTASALLAVVAVQTAKLVLAKYGLQVGNEEPFSIEFFNLSLLGLDLLLLQGVGIMRMEIHNYPSWSISIEFWLYLIFAVMMLLVRTRTLRIGVSIAIVALCVVHFANYWSVAPLELRTLDTRGMPKGMLSFFQGILLFYLYQSLQRWRGSGARANAERRPASGSGVLGAAQVVTAALALYLVGRQHLLGSYQLLIPFSFTLLLLFLLPDRGLVATWLQTRPIQWLGKHSYSIYLVHVSVLTVFDWPGRTIPEPAKHLVGLAFLATVFGLSMLTYRFVEEPWRERGRRIADRIAAGGSAKHLQEFSGKAEVSRRTHS